MFNERLEFPLNFYCLVNEACSLKPNEVIITGAVRTPIGSFGGTLRDIPVVQRIAEGKGWR